MTELETKLTESFDRMGIMYFKQNREELVKLGIKDLRECGISLDAPNLDELFVSRAGELTSEAELVYLEHKHGRKSMPDLKMITEPINGNLIIYTMTDYGEKKEEYLTLAKQNKSNDEFAGFSIIGEKLSHTFIGPAEQRSHIDGFENHSKADFEKIVKKVLELAGKI